MKRLESAMKHEVLNSAKALINAFENNDFESYFAAFSENTTLVASLFEKVITSKTEFKDVINNWIINGFKVISCKSTNPVTTIHGDTAIFIHEVVTRIIMNEDTIESHDMETIIFEYDHSSSRWMVCHEHISPISSNS